MLVLIPNGSIDTPGLGLLKFVWKVVEGVIDTRVKVAVKFHYVLHEFHAGRGTGTAIVELKIAQDLLSMYQYPSLLSFLI